MPLLCIHARKMKTYVKYNDLYINVHSSLTQNTPKLKAIQMSINSSNVVNAYNGKQ